MYGNIVEYEGIHVRLLSEFDIETLRTLRNKDKNRINFIYQKEISHKEQSAWYDSYCKNDRDYMYSIIRKSDNALIGFAALYNINHDEAEFGRLLVDKEKYKQPGLGTYILKHLISIAKEELHLKKLTLEVFSDNTPALTIYSRCGFKEYSRSIINDREIIKMKLYL